MQIHEFAERSRREPVFGLRSNFWFCHLRRQHGVERKRAENCNIFYSTAINIFVLSNHDSFRVLSDKLLPYILSEKICLYFSIGNGQPREPALCQLYRRTFVPYGTYFMGGIACT